MPASSGQRSRRQSASGRTDYADPSMRVSDAERSQVADRLSKHYGDGRLDQAEFEQRLDQAMNAKTRADLDGLFTDLPGEAPARPGWAAGDVTPQPPPRRRHHIGVIIAAVLVVWVLAHGVFHLFFMPWVLIAVLAFIWLRHVDTRRRRY